MERIVQKPGVIWPVALISALILIAAMAVPAEAAVDGSGRGVATYEFTSSGLTAGPPPCGSFTAMTYVGIWEATFSVTTTGGPNAGTSDFVGMATATITATTPEWNANPSGIFHPGDDNCNGTVDATGGGETTTASQPYPLNVIADFDEADPAIPGDIDCGSFATGTYARSNNDVDIDLADGTCTVVDKDDGVSRSDTDADTAIDGVLGPCVRKNNPPAVLPLFPPTHCVGSDEQLTA